MRIGEGDSSRPSGWWIIGLTGDPTPGDPASASVLAAEFRSLAENAERAGRAVSGLLSDQAVVNWVGASGNAFRSASEPFPGQLGQMHRGYDDAAAALDKFSTAMASAQFDADSAYYQAHTALEGMGFSDDDAHCLAGIGDANAYLTAAAKLLLTRQKPDPPQDPRFPHPSPAPAPGNAAPGISTPLSQQTQGALSAMFQGFTGVQTASLEYKNASNACAKALEAAAGASIASASWSGASSGTFGQRFAAAGGNPADLVFTNAAAGADLQLDELPAQDATPADIAAWWKTLTPDQQNNLLADHPEALGGLDGVPCAARNKANMALLDQAIAKDPHNQGLLNLKNRLLTGDGTPNATPYLLLGFDTDYTGHAIIATSDPDYAKNVATYTPGFTTEVSGSSPDVAKDFTFDANDNQDELGNVTKLQQEVEQNHPGTSFAGILLYNYDAPNLDSVTQALPVAGEGRATDGAAHIDSFLNGVVATNQTGSPQHLTAIGHSYGSLALGKASLPGAGNPAQDVVFIGSPGVGVDHASDLGVNDPSHHVWAGAAANDPVTTIEYQLDTNPLDSAFGLDNDGGYFSENPATHKFGGQVFHVAPGSNIPFDMNNHMNYFKPGSDSLRNIGDIVSGDYSDVSDKSRGH